MRNGMWLGLFAVFCFACSSESSSSPDAGGSGGTSGAGATAGTGGAGGVGGTGGTGGTSDAGGVDANIDDAGVAGSWESVETTTDDAQIIIEKVSYRSEGLRIFGQVCRPKAAGVFPLMVINHGGVSGIGGDWNGGTCANTARGSYVVIQSSYRGEDGSEGMIEGCLGEVTDVLTMIDIALELPYVDAERVEMWGASHGGCITTRAVQRGAPVHAAVDIFGPSDWATSHAFWKERIAENPPNIADYQGLVDLIEGVTGGTPEQFPEAYRIRSPAHLGADLANAPLPFMIVQGVDDPLVPPSQSCQLAAAAGGFESYHIDDTQAVVTTPPSGCEDAEITWHAAPHPNATWLEARYLIVYDGTGHAFEGGNGTLLVNDALGFLSAKLPAR